MGNDRIRKPKVEKINWQLKNSKQPIECAVMSWDDYTQLEQMFFEKGWEAHRLHFEQKEVERFQTLAKKLKKFDKNKHNG